MKKGSETKTIKRSQINLNPFNPKHHTDNDISQQKANIRRVGILGGLTWNEATGNLIDGHKRVLSLDAIHKYDGTPETDYDVKVEAVDFDDKTEKEQMVFQAKAIGKIDYNIVANFIDEIDFKNAGFSEDDANQIKQLQDELDETLNDGMVDMADDFIAKNTEEKPQVTELPTEELSIKEIEDNILNKPKMSREEVREAKQHCADVATKRQDDIDTFVFIDFENVEQKLIFCELLGVEPENSMRISGSQILGAIE